METKNVLIVGSHSAMGKKIIEQQLEKGNQIYSLSRREEPPLPEGPINHFCCNPTEEATFPTIDVPLHSLVYCPGTISLKPFSSLPLTTFVEDMEINFFGAVKVVQHYLPNLQKGAPASILFFSTVAVQKGFLYHTSIAAAKGALEGFARSLAADLAPTIRVNVIAPSLTETPLAHDLLRDEKKRDHNAKRHPLQSLGEPDDMANLATFLLSDRAKWITGQVIGVDGGLGAIQFV